jgi:hypothetical protein
MLQRLTQHNDRIPLLPRVHLIALGFLVSQCRVRESLTRFHSRTAPNISILDYLKRIVRFTNVEVSQTFIHTARMTHIAVEIMSFDYFALHRSNLCPYAIIHIVISDMSSLHHCLYRRVQQRSLRCILRKYPLCQSGRHICA